MSFEYNPRLNQIVVDDPEDETKAMIIGGITLRDQFAAAALPAVIKILDQDALNEVHKKGTIVIMNSSIAKLTWSIADAMLKERAKRYHEEFDRQEEQNES